MRTQQEDSILDMGIQGSNAVSWQLGQQLASFVAPLLLELDTLIDKRLVRTLLATLGVIIQFRNRPYGLLLSELGAYLMSADQAPAGTKRLSNLLRCTKWEHTIIEKYLWDRAKARVEEFAQNGNGEAGDVLALWDESVVEKAESIKLEGLCAVRSSKAARLKRIKPGYFNPPGGRPIFVPGMHWLNVLLIGRSEKSGPPCVARMEWWTTRGEYASDKRSVQEQLLRECATQWGQSVVHIFDQGFAGGPWLQLAFSQSILFVMRWRRGYTLIDEAGVERKAWQIVRGKRSWQHRYVWDAPHQCYRKSGVVAVRVRHPLYPAPLWLVVSRPGKGREPWYLLTNEPVLTAADAWRVVFAYARRWQIEMSFRYGKSELAMESPRLWKWENRLKLLLMVTLVYAFLLSLLDPSQELLRQWLLRWWCHRNGKRNREASVPLYRLRSALSRLWLDYPPPSSSLLFP
jgi:Transposase DDE domain